MKKSVFVFLITSIICLLSISLIYALDCSNDQLIMKVSEELESFGSSWDEPGLNTDYNKVCHDEIFSKPGNTIHECVSGNNVLSLLKEGSFLDFPKKTGDIDVCYGTLKCSVKTQCALNEEKLFVLKDTGLSSSWNFDDNLNDLVGSNDGINSGTIFADGKIGKAVRFDEDDYVDLGQDIYSNQDVEKGSIEFWVNLEQSGQSQFIYTAEDWMVFWINPSKYISLAIWDTSVGGYKYIYSKEPIQENQWYHVIGTWEQGIFKLYINGQLANENSYSAPINLDSASREIRLGKATYWSYISGKYKYPYHLYGMIDELRIRKESLSAEVVQELYEFSNTNFDFNEQDLYTIINPNYKSEPDSLLKFEDNLEDEIGNLDGTNNGAGFINGYDGRALEFIPEDYVSLGQDIYSNQDVESGSIETWFKLPTIEPSYQIIYSNEDWIVLWIDGVKKQAVFSIWNGALSTVSGAYKNIYYNQNLETDKWYHAIGTWKQGIFKLYINGQLAGENSYLSIDVDSTNNEVRLGKASNWEEIQNKPYYFTGILDETAFYPNALTQEQAKYNYLQYSSNKRVCCDLDGAVSISWQNMNNEQITSADLEDTIKAVLSDTGLAEGTKVNVTIKELTLIDEWVYDENNPLEGIVNSNGDLEAKWTITQQDYDKTSQHSRYVFTARGIESLELAISDLIFNSPPEVSITPSVEEAFINTKITFEISITDQDDDVSATWDFQGDKTEKSNCLTTGNCSMDYIFSEKGVKDIFVMIEEMTRNQKAYAGARVLIFEEGLNLFPIISRPNVINSGKAVLNNRVILFEGTQSYVSKCSTTCSLPEEPSGKTEITGCYNLNSLECFNYPSDWFEDSGYDLYFNWTFSDADNVYGKLGDSSSPDYFEKNFSKFGKQNSSLKLGFYDGTLLWSKPSTISFIVSDSGYYCHPDYNGNSWAIWDSSTEDFNLLSSLEDCSKEEGWDDEGERLTCCPLGEFCDLQTSECSPIILDIKTCEDYNTENFESDQVEDECKADSFNIGISSVENTVKYSGFCTSKTPVSISSGCKTYVSDCGCEWDSTKDKCITSYDLTSECAEGGSCSYDLLEITDNCDTTGSRSYNRVATYTPLSASGPLEDPTGECIDDIVSVSCGEPISRLPFFSFLNFVLVGLLLAGFYFLKNNKSQ